MGLSRQLGVAAAFALTVGCTAEERNTGPTVLASVDSSPPASPVEATFPVEPATSSSSVEPLALDSVGVLAAVAAHAVGPGLAHVSVRDTLGVGDERDASVYFGGPSARPLTPDERAAIEAELAPTQVAWIDQDQVADLQQRQLEPSAPEFMVLTMAVPRTTSDTVAVTTQVWCGALCGVGSTYLLANEAGAWTVTGTTGGSWVS